jgi:ParB/RepB/Spo0J family partition protein
MGSAYKQMLAIGGQGEIADSLRPRARDQGVRQAQLLVIDLDRLRSGKNVRTDMPEDDVRQLAESLKAVGQQQAISVRWDGEAWAIISGHTRYHAAKLAGLTSLKATVHETHLTPEQEQVMQLVENCARRDMSDLDTATSVQELMQARQCTMAEAGKIIGRSESWVSRKLQLLRLPDAEKAKLANGKLSKTEARAQVVKRPSGRRRGPDPVQLRLGGVTVQITWRRAGDRTTVAAALDQVRGLAEQLDREQQAKDAA